MFPSSSSRTGYFVKLTYFHRRISEVGGAEFWYHGMRNCFITVAERELMLPHALNKRLVNHAPPRDVTEGYAADWTIGHPRDRVFYDRDLTGFGCMPVGERCLSCTREAWSGVEASY